MNSGTEQMSGEDLTGTQHQFAAMSAWRNSWFADESDIIVTPVPMKPNFLAYVGETLGFDSSSVSIVAPNLEGNHAALSDARLLSARIIDDLRLLISSSAQWTVMPCYYTAGVAELVSLLGIEKPAVQQFAAQCGCDVLNRKTHFRQLATGAKMPLADGSIAHSPASLAKAIRKHLQPTGTAIIKKDNGAGGAGNITITTGATTPLPGSRETRQAPEDIEAMADELWKDMTDQWSHTVVIESYHTALHKFYLEFVIREDGSPRFLNSGTIRLRPASNHDAKELVWVGLDIPAELRPFSCADALSLSMPLVLLAAQLGYRGPLNIDAILTDTNELIFNEVNARWGGGSVLHTLGERLLGSQYGNDHVLSSLRNVSSPPLNDVLSILRQRDLYFSQESKEGVLILACDELVTNTMECLLIGSSRTRVREIEALLLEAVQ